MDHDRLVERVDEMQAEIREYQERFGADSPEDAALRDAKIDAEALREWKTTRRNLSFGEVALALDETVRIIR